MNEQRYRVRECRIIDLAYNGDLQTEIDLWDSACDGDRGWYWVTAQSPEQAAYWFAWTRLARPEGGQRFATVIQATGIHNAPISAWEYVVDITPAPACQVN